MEGDLTSHYRPILRRIGSSGCGQRAAQKFAAVRRISPDEHLRRVPVPEFHCRPASTSSAPRSPSARYCPPSTASRRSPPAAWTRCASGASPAGVAVGIAFIVRLAQHRADDRPEAVPQPGLTGSVAMDLVSTFAIVGFAIFTTRYLQSVLGMLPTPRCCRWCRWPGQSRRRRSRSSWLSAAAAATSLRAASSWPVPNSPGSRSCMRGRHLVRTDRRFGLCQRIVGSWP
jgi:hypothetical protein